jgi:ubiquitin-activating enzyme E1
MDNKPDENLYSRQMAAIGAEAQGKLIVMKVFLQGLTGVGIETAKNLILAGPKQVVLYDDELVQINNLATNFYVRESDVGKTTRAAASLP